MTKHELPPLHVTWIAYCMEGKTLQEVREERGGDVAELFADLGEALASNDLDTVWDCIHDTTAAPASREWLRVLHVAVSDYLETVDHAET